MNLEQLLDHRSDIQLEIANLQEGGHTVPAGYWVTLERLNSLIKQEVCEHRNTYETGTRYFDGFEVVDNFKTTCEDCGKDW